MRIVFATGNAGKMREIRDILSDVDAEVFSLKDLGIESKAEENGKTYAENAYIKANEIYQIFKAENTIGTAKNTIGTNVKTTNCNMTDDINNLVENRPIQTIFMADDSGLGIDFLNGEPGVHSARFMGHDTPYTVKNAYILDKMKDVPDEKRGAGFVCHITAILDNGKIYEFEDEMRGFISRESKGKEGFGYDPIFFIPEMGRTSGELSEEEKNKISHRGKVLRIVKAKLVRDGIIKLKK